MELSAEKKAARAAAVARRALLHGDPGPQIARLLQENPWAGIVSAYLPMRGEADPLPGLSGRVCMPVIIGKGQALRFREWTPGCALEEGPFGAMVPARGDWLEPDLLLVPLLAFDRRLYRLGYGGGFYDRTLAELRAGRRVLAAGVAFAGQQIPSVPVGEFDQKLDAVVTEQGVLTA